MNESKQFAALIVPKKGKTFPVKKSAIFDSDSDDEPLKKMPKIPQKPLSKKLIEAEKSEDPSIYEYDEIYDDMKAQEKAKLAPKTTEKPSRYIDSLLKAADKRKKNRERRIQKRIIEKREEEGDKFKEKESFVTPSYKKKMQEMEEEEERERRENELNDMMDVTKQKDLSGFYRHFLKQSIGEEKVPVFGERSGKKEPEPPKSPVNKVENEKIDPDLDRDSDISLSSDENEDSKDSADKKLSCSDDAETAEKPKSKKRKIHRQIRKRFDEESEEEAEMEERDKARKKVIESKKDRDSSRNSAKYKADEKNRKSIESSQSESNSEEETETTENSKLNDLVKDDKHPNKDNESNGDEKKERRNIFEKRTVGTVFTDAQARYFQRMSARSS